MVEATGKEAYMQWCMKVTATERDAFLAYSTRIGTEMEYAAAQPDHPSVEASVERTVTEALMVNPKTEYVGGLTFPGRAPPSTSRIGSRAATWTKSPCR